jgi:hypothetical protein
VTDEHLVADLIRAILDNMESAGAEAQGWESLAIILEFRSRPTRGPSRRR